jgi:ABC-type nitrate/sulfonate/bicarbonate transport system substrate-binding protein
MRNRCVVGSIRFPRVLLVAVTALTAVALCACVATLPSSGATLEPMAIKASVIGSPIPIFSSLYVNVAQQEGFFKKVGLDASFKYYGRGTDVARTVVAGDAAIAMTASAAVLAVIAGGAPVVAVGGMQNQDFFVASSVPGVTGCRSLKGQTVAADGIGNARYIYLKAYLATCGLSMSDVDATNLANSQLVQAAAAGVVKTAVFHIDELAQVEYQKPSTKWVSMPTPPALEKQFHYTMFLVRKSTLQSQSGRQAVVRYMAAFILAEKWMSNPVNLDAFAQIAARATGDNPVVTKNAIRQFNGIGYWSSGMGLDKAAVDSEINLLVENGIIKKSQAPTYDRAVDTSIYPQALKLADSVGE